MPCKVRSHATASLPLTQRFSHYPPRPAASAFGISYGKRGLLFFASCACRSSLALLFRAGCCYPSLRPFQGQAFSLSLCLCFLVGCHRSLRVETYGAVPIFFLVFISAVYLVLFFPYPPASSAVPPSHFTFLHCYSQTSALSYPRTGCYWIIFSADRVGLVAQSQTASSYKITNNTTVFLAFCALVCYICK